MGTSTLRQSAIEEITATSPPTIEAGGPLSEIWACDVFSLATMEECLSKKAFKAMKNDGPDRARRSTPPPPTSSPRP